MKYWAGIFFLFLAGCGKDDPAALSAPAAPEVESVLKAESSENKVLMPKEEKRINPFLTLEEEKVFGDRPREVLKDVILSAVFNSANGSYAVIEGEVVRENDTIAGKTVLSIGKNSVVLKDTVREYIVNIQGGR